MVMYTNKLELDDIILSQNINTGVQTMSSLSMLSRPRSTMMMMMMMCLC